VRVSTDPERVEFVDIDYVLELYMAPANGRARYIYDAHVRPRDARAPLGVNRCCVLPQPALPYRRGANGTLPVCRCGHAGSAVTASQVPSSRWPACEGRLSLGAAQPIPMRLRPPCARTLSAAMRCPVRHCAAVAETSNVDGHRGAGHVPRCRPMCVVHAPVYTCRFCGAIT
jgi:hypothetical protein